MHWICTFCLKHKYLIVHFQVRLRPALGEMGEWGDAGEVSLCHPLHFLLYSLYRLSVPPFPQVPEGWCFPIILLVLGEVLGTNIKKENVNTMKLIHHWAFRVIFFICSLLITPWGRFIISVSQRLKRRLWEGRKVVQITLLINRNVGLGGQPVWLQNIWAPNCTRLPPHKKRYGTKSFPTEGFRGMVETERLF